MKYTREMRVMKTLLGDLSYFHTEENSTIEIRIEKDEFGFEVSINGDDDRICVYLNNECLDKRRG